MASDVMAMSGAAYDAQALNGLKRDAAADPQGNLKQVAQQVEGMFVQMMLKSMRAALPQDGVLSSDQTRLYTSMYDQQIAQQMSQKGLGLADMMVKQMTNANAVPSETAGTAPMALDNEVLQTLPNQALEQMIRRAVPKAPPAAAPLSLSTTAILLPVCQMPARAASEQSGIPASADCRPGGAGIRLGAARNPDRLTVRRATTCLVLRPGATGRGPVTEITTTEFEQGVAKKGEGQIPCLRFVLLGDC
ncbi:Flagellar protein FlgJ [peptidoglycan hydrolase] (plasmid) [Klebsiella aerogenes]|nr:Flagellar protein FlgJ [peptidoglycan hydrolase] [Klebsiella aerogenes]